MSTTITTKHSDPNIKWNADLYDTKHNFVSKYGEDVLGWLAPEAGERILDLGCGTGELANKIHESGAEVIGNDKSPEMIAKAKASFPELTFEVKDATDFQYAQPFDAIFSNATLHWINEADKVIACMYNNLKPGGRLVLEMGGKGNVQSIVNAIEQAITEAGLQDKIADAFWFFPSLSKYTTMLEQQGFRVVSAIHFDRPTKLEGDNGMENWINMFGGFFYKHLTADQGKAITARAVEILKKDYYKNGNWTADYVRLRVKAVKF